MNAIPLPILPSTSEPAEYNQNYVLYWNDVLNDLIRITVTIKGPLNDPPGGSRAYGMLHLCLNDAYFAISPNAQVHSSTYLTKENTNAALRLPDLDGANDTRQAVAGAAITCLHLLFATHLPSVDVNASDAMGQFIARKATDFSGLDPQCPSYKFGAKVSQVLLSYLHDPSVYDERDYTPVDEGQQYKYDADPTNPIKIVPVNVNEPKGPTKVIRFSDAPYYGAEAKRLAVQGMVDSKPFQHVIGDPPVGFSVHNQASYDSAFREVYAEGGAVGLNTTHRDPKQQRTGLFWAYDGTNLIGTPLRHYSQILRRLAWSRKPAGSTDETTNADFIRLFALAMTAMADAGVFSWHEKYYYSFWRPLSGSWCPRTNSNGTPFKPPFPSYPSGHATFGGAFFQAIRLYYKRRDNLTFADDAPDSINFDASSDELNGINRDQLRAPYDPTQSITDQLGTVRTDVGLLHFNSCWEAMFDNAISRVFLGVHWGFDAFAPEDVQVCQNADGTVNYKSPDDIRYRTMGPRADRQGLFPIGGVPLGIGIATDIFQSNLKPTPLDQQPASKPPAYQAAAVPTKKLPDVKVDVATGSGVVNGHTTNGSAANGNVHESQTGGIRNGISDEEQESLL